MEIGCGQCFLIPELSRHCNSVYGIDLHNELKKTESIVKKECAGNFNLINADIRGIPFKKGTFELIVCLSALEHIKELDSAIREITYVIKEGNVVILGFPAKNKVTSKLFDFLGYNDEDIHPSGHREILESCKSLLAFEEEIGGLENEAFQGRSAFS